MQGPLIRSRGEPRLDDPWGLDRSVSDALNGGSDPFLWRAPDVFGQVVAPTLVVGLYGADALVLSLRGRSASGDLHADHELVALVEAYSLTVLLTQTAKVAIGRERPLYGLERPWAPPPDDDATLSFFSLHASSSFCLAAFLHRDFSDWLTAERGAGVLVGRVLPGAALYGTASVIALSRVIDQRHYLTDVALGAAVGGVLGNVIYALHFDGSGRPRRRRPAAGVEITFVPGGVGLAGSF